MNSFPSTGTSIALVEPVSLIIDGMRARIAQQDDLQVAGVATDGNSGLELLLEARPDVAIVEIDVAGRSGFDIVA